MCIFYYFTDTVLDTCLYCLLILGKILHSEQKWRVRNTKKLAVTQWISLTLPLLRRGRGAFGRRDAATAVTGGEGDAVEVSLPQVQ